jgi:UDP-4-amino-4,6-dideoxy-N-acetyl-beta-L-altrosamine transaminase
MTPALKRPLSYGRQCIDDDDIAAVTAVLRSDYLTTGPTAARFETAFARAVDAPFAVVCSSGTAALHLAALALDIGSGDRVVVPSLTFLATANAVRLAAGEVVFADVDPDSGLLTAATLEAALQRAGGTAKAVFPVHLNGQTAPMAELANVAGRRGMKVVEDACHALGTTYRDNGAARPVGAASHSDLVCFSFHPVKTIAMGEGGAVTGRDPALAQRLLRLRSHGMERQPERFENAALAKDNGDEPNAWYYEMPEVGLNYRASDIHCALGLSQLAKLDRFKAKRRALAARYDERLARLSPMVRPVRKLPDCDPVLHLYAVLIDFKAAGRSRNAVMKALRERGVGTQVHYVPVHRQPYYRKRYGDPDLPGADAYYQRCLSLPLHADMEIEEVDVVVDALETVLGR